MIRSTRAFLVLSLAALASVAGLHVLAMSALANTWAAMVHLMLFGWVSAMIYAITYHTMPIFSGRDFPYQRIIWLHAAMVLPGLGLAVMGLLSQMMALIQAGIVVQLIAAVLYSFNITSLFMRGVPRANRPTPPAIPHQDKVDRIGRLATRNAGLCLPLVYVLLLTGYAGWLRGDWVLAGEHLAALGWIMLTVVGVAYHMLPRFNGLGVRGPGWARAQIICHHAALVLMVPALGFGSSIGFAIGGLLMAVAMVLFAWTVWPALHSQHRQQSAVRVSGDRVAG